MKALYSLLNTIFATSPVEYKYEDALATFLQQIGEIYGFSIGFILTNDGEVLTLWQSSSGKSIQKNILYSEAIIEENIINLINNFVLVAPSSPFHIPDLSLHPQHPLYSLYPDYNIKSIIFIPYQEDGGRWKFCFFLHQEVIFNDDIFLQELSLAFRIVHIWFSQLSQINQAQIKLHRLSQALNWVPVNILICQPDHKLLQYHLQPYLKAIVKPNHTLTLNDILPAEIIDSIIPHIPIISKAEQNKISFTIFSTSLKTTFEVIITSLSDKEIIIILNDITPQKEIERCNTDFINIVSHELRSPLTTMLLVADLIQEGGQPEESQRYWQILRSELEREKNLIEKLLMVGRLQRGDLKLCFTSIDISKEIKKSIQTIQPLAAAKNISIKASISKKLPFIQADPIGISQIFNNILNNAVKYSYSNSSIRIIAKQHPQQNLDKHELIQGVRISIRDQGIGIPDEDIPKLFQRFFRAKNAIEEDISGSGIGLYVVKSIIEEHKGSITINSKLNEGTVVTIWLPCNPTT